MKRLHVHVTVEDLTASVGFYSTLFGAAPAVQEADYAKWMMDDPRVNFAISARGRTVTGLDHLGIEADAPKELSELSARLKAAGETTFDQAATTCCYARSDKSWVTDPSGLRWETFFTSGSSTHYGEDEPGRDGADAGACCTPHTPQGVCCSPKAEMKPTAPCCGA